MTRPLSHLHVVLTLACSPLAASAQTYERVDVGNAGELGNHSAEFGEISDDGRYVVFGSTATNLGALTRSIYVRDRFLATTTLIPMPPAPGYRNPRISRDGNKITFTTEDELHAFVHDRSSGVTTEIVVPGITYKKVTGLDRTGTFAALSTRTAPAGQEQVYRLHIQSSTVVLCSRSAAGMPVVGEGGDIDASGDLIVFASTSGSIVPNDTNGTSDIFAYHVAANLMERVSLTSGGAQASGQRAPSVDAAGRYVAFCSMAANLVPNDTNNREDVFVRDILLGTTSIVSLTSSQAQLFLGVLGDVVISGDGTKVAFSSLEPLAPLDLSPNSSIDVFVRDLVAGTLLPVSTGSSAGTVANVRGMGMAFDGSEVLLASEQPGMTQLPRLTGIFVVKYGTRCSITEYCTALPNSTGKPSTIRTAGTASLSGNNLLIASTDLPSQTMAMLVAGTSAIEPGTPFGNGLLCIGGTLLRHPIQAVTTGLFVEHPDVTSPAYSNLAAGDVRNFQIYYRDAAAGGASFNTTDAVSVTFCW